MLAPSLLGPDSNLGIPSILPDTNPFTIRATLNDILNADLLFLALIRLDDETAAASALEVWYTHAVKAGVGDWLDAEPVGIGDAGVVGLACWVADGY